MRERRERKPEEKGERETHLPPALKKGLTFRCYTIMEITKFPEKREKGKKFIYDGLESGALKPIIAKTFPLDDMVGAHKYMESNVQMGKIVVEV